MGEAPRCFRYLADPVCVASLVLYTINRYFLKPHHIGGWFTHGYFNDVLCLPLFVPMVLYTQHLIGLRKHFGFPRSWEIFQNWAVFAVVFQVVIPRFPKTFIAAGDPFDILAYFAGGVIAGFYWSAAARHARARSEFA
ncbi:MAG: hypothetical protein JWP03_2190 [Phycisphaerales bacterium]|jgi:hypothetical protein|nr:hypothetical protein [Phycisphaerales bacterium]